MRISTSLELPTVSIQNGRRIWRPICVDRVWSSSEKNGFGPGWRHVADGEKIDHELQPLPDAAQLRAVLVLRIGLVDVDQAGDVLHHGCRQPPRHRVPVPLHEHERHDRLQDHHRHDHDQQRAGIEAGRHPALERVAHPAIGPGDALRRIADERQAGVERAHELAYSVFERSGRPVRVKKTRQNKS